MPVTSSRDHDLGVLTAFLGGDSVQLRLAERSSIHATAFEYCSGPSNQNRVSDMELM